jgi:hypothetical protein
VAAGTHPAASARRTSNDPMNCFLISSLSHPAPCAAAIHPLLPHFATERVALFPFSRHQPGEGFRG